MKYNRILRIALLGDNKSGKTTLLHLLCKLLEPEQSQLTYEFLCDAPLQTRKRLRVPIQVIPLNFQNKIIHFIDCPNEIDVRKCLATGAETIDGAIFVIAATSHSNIIHKQLKVLQHYKDF